MTPPGGEQRESPPLLSFTYYILYKARNQASNRRVTWFQLSYSIVYEKERKAG